MYGIASHLHRVSLRVNKIKILLPPEILFKQKETFKRKNILKRSLDVLVTKQPIAVSFKKTLLKQAMW